jgi:hypothetical protein
MKIKFRYGFCFAIFLGGIAFASSASNFPVGTYSYTQQGEELIDGKKASITWNIVIKDNKNAVVTVSSWHAPFTCDGKYALSNKGEQFALTWSSKDNADTDCDISPPQILLKKSQNGKVLIYSELFPWDSSGWKNTRVIR